MQPEAKECRQLLEGQGKGMDSGSVCCVMPSRICLFATPWTGAKQAPLSMDLSRQEHWGGLPCPLTGDLPNPGIEARSPTSQAILYHLSHQGSPNLPREPPKRCGHVDTLRQPRFQTYHLQDCERVVLVVLSYKVSGTLFQWQQETNRVSGVCLATNDRVSQVVLSYNTCPETKGQVAYQTVQREECSSL